MYQNFRFEDQNYESILDNFQFLYKLLIVISKSEIKKLCLAVEPDELPSGRVTFGHLPMSPQGEENPAFEDEEYTEFITVQK